MKEVMHSVARYKTSTADVRLSALVSQQLHSLVTAIFCTHMHTSVVIVTVLKAYLPAHLHLTYYTIMNTVRRSEQ